LELKLNPAYMMVNKISLDPGAPGDCSGKIWAIFASCGLPVLRITAYDMHRNLGNWRFPDVVEEDAKRYALVWFTFTKDRPYGHIGLLTFTKKDGWKMAHASQRLGFIEVPINFVATDYFFGHHTAVKDTDWK
jgi:hypothetical protein